MAKHTSTPNRTFTWDKKLEMYIKTSGLLGGANGSLPTVISPADYKTRFTEAMQRYFLCVPDKFSGFAHWIEGGRRAEQADDAGNAAPDSSSSGGSGSENTSGSNKAGADDKADVDGRSSSSGGDDKAQEDGDSDQQLSANDAAFKVYL